MQTVKNKIRESERSRRRYLHRFLSLDTDLTELVPENELIAEQYEQDDAFTVGEVERTLTPEQYKLLRRLIFDKASHFEVAQEFNITVYASQKRLERIREKLYKKFPEQKRKKK